METVILAPITTVINTPTDTSAQLVATYIAGSSTGSNGSIVVCAEP